MPCAAVAPSTVGGGLCVGLSCSCLGTAGVLHEAMSCRAAPAMRSAAAAPTSLGGGICAGCALLSSCCSPACKSASSVSSSSLDSIGAQVALGEASCLGLLVAVLCGTSLAGHGLGVGSISSLRSSTVCAALFRCCCSVSSLVISLLHRLTVINACCCSIAKTSSKSMLSAMAGCVTGGRMS